MREKNCAKTTKMREENSNGDYYLGVLLWWSFSQKTWSKEEVNTSFFHSHPLWVQGQIKSWNNNKRNLGWKDSNKL